MRKLGCESQTLEFYSKGAPGTTMASPGILLKTQYLRLYPTSAESFVQDSQVTCMHIKGALRVY